MNICFPVLKVNGLESEIHRDFASAPAFLLIQTNSNSISTIQNKDQHHAHGACDPIKTLGNQMVDAVIVGMIDKGALRRLNKLGIKVFQAKASTVKGNIALYKDQNLSEFIILNCCPGGVHIRGNKQ
jgi:predicted Fe-Mo cluster-binding NifX family protein